ncbi:MAG: hypothetical protein EWV83_17145 [Microcystis sp. M_OC_Ca_00000000_S217Cul]|nr:MAG: hypothetical protein EWV83_17145 [Microcystis sp. M_OC_Ca_00000000_S217Cul]TRT82815.1 MAG: hypothetical protein EWV66_24050 [Microcystis sp. M_OC_Ca_00000000_C217Col]
MGTPLIKGGLRGDRHPPYQGGQGGSIFNLIITTYQLSVSFFLVFFVANYLHNTQSNLITHG